MRKGIVIFFFTFLLVSPSFISGSDLAAVKDDDNVVRIKENQLFFREKIYPCAIGRSGIISPEKKVEGDGATPTGKYPITELWYREDKVKLEQEKINLPIKVISDKDGWCDDGKDPINYNKHVILPYGGSHEELYRKDDLYDAILVIGYNMPAILNKGSAIFIHIARKNYEPTAGCIALERKDLEEIIYKFGKDPIIIIG